MIFYHVIQILNLLGPIYHSYFGLHPEKDGYVEIEKDKLIPYSKVLESSNVVIPFSKIVLKYSKDTWIEKPDNWFNKPSKWWIDYNNHLKPYALPYLNTRKYIKIDKPFMQITVSEEKKGSKLTIDDVLFATRGLMADDTRIVDGGYKILKVTKDTLTIEPKIDNWST